MMSAPSRRSQSKRPRGPAARKAWLSDPEVKLMLRVRDDDVEAFAELQRRYAGRVFGYFCRGLKNQGDAEDLTQEVFLRLYRARARYQPRARFATWMFHITQNVARTALRSRRRHPCVPLASGPAAQSPVLETLVSDHEAPSQPVERDELAGVVRAAVAELTARQRTALELRHFHDHSYAEVGEELAMTAKAAKSLVYRARNQLRESLTAFVR
jgi:RNA polymerase sigma-70 factor (ECF subfamily)